MRDVPLSNGRVLHFPDGTPDNVVQMSIQKYSAPQEAQAPTDPTARQPFTQLHRFEQPGLKELEIDPKTVAAGPARAVEKIPGVGPALSTLVPETPAGWG